MITPEMIKSAVEEPELVNDCDDHSVYIKDFCGRKFVAVSVREGNLHNIICAGWLYAIEELLAQQAN